MSNIRARRHLTPSPSFVAPASRRPIVGGPHEVVTIEGRRGRDAHATAGRTPALHDKLAGFHSLHKVLAIFSVLSLRSPAAVEEHFRTGG